MIGNGFEFIAKRNQLMEELGKVESDIVDINIKLCDTLPLTDYCALKKRKLKLAGRKVQIQQELSAIKQDKHFLLNEAFMQTCIALLDPQDIAEIWDKLYVDHPYLRDERAI